MHQALTNPVISALPVRQDSNTDCECLVSLQHWLLRLGYSCVSIDEELEEKTLAKIAAARKVVKQDIALVNERLKLVKDATHHLKREVARLETAQREDFGYH